MEKLYMLGQIKFHSQCNQLSATFVVFFLESFFSTFKEALQIDPVFIFSSDLVHKP